MLRPLIPTLAAVAAIGLAVSVTPADARIAAGPATPTVESNKVDARCHHHRWSSRWHCYRRHHYWHAHPYYWQPYYYHNRWQSRRHWRW